MAGFAPWPEFIGNSNGETRKPVGILIKCCLDLIEIGKIGTVNMIAESLGHAEFETEIYARGGLELQPHAKRHRRSRRGLASRRSHTDADTDSQIWCPATKTLVGFTDTIGKEIELAPDIKGIYLRREALLRAAGQHIAHIGRIAAETKRGEHTAHSPAGIRKPAHRQFAGKTGMTVHIGPVGIAYIAAHAEFGAYIEFIWSRLGIKPCRAQRQRYHRHQAAATGECHLRGHRHFFYWIGLKVSRFRVARQSVS